MKQGTKATFCWECKPEMRAVFRSVDGTLPNWFWTAPCSWAGKEEQAEQLGSMGWLLTTGSQAAAAAPSLAGAGLALGSSITCSLGSKFSSQPDSTVDFFLAPPAKQIRPQSTTCRLFLHDIRWKGAVLPLSGMPAQPDGCLGLGHRQGMGEECCKDQQGASCSSSTRCPNSPCTLDPHPTAGCMGALVLPSAGAALSGEPAAGRGVQPAAIDLLFRAWLGK